MTDSLEVRWSSAILDAGFAQVPTLFLRHAAEIGLDATDQALLVHLMGFVRQGDKAHPSYATLGGLIGLKRQAVKRRVKRLAARGIIGLRCTTTARGDFGTNVISLAPLGRLVSGTVRVRGTETAEGRRLHLRGVRGEANHQAKSKRGASGVGSPETLPRVRRDPTRGYVETPEVEALRNTP